jgi:hypothetical protein
MLTLLVLIAFIAVLVAADPAKPTLPSQYSQGESNVVMDTNAGYPPHYEETITATYYDITQQAKRFDVSYSSYGQKGPYQMIYKYDSLYPVQCGKEQIQAPRAYMIVGSTCCYADLVQDCDANPQTIPTAQTMIAPALPTKIAYKGVVDNMDEWVSDIYLKQEVPVMHSEYYFDSKDHTTQLKNFLAVNAGPQFINATTTYTGAWKDGAQDAKLFDISSYDCSKLCQNAQVHNLAWRKKYGYAH